MGWRALTAGPALVAVRQAGPLAVFEFGGTVEGARLRLVIADGSAVRAELPVVGGIVELDLDAIAARTAGTLELSLVGDDGPVAWHGARWTWGATTVWEADGRRALLTVKPGRTQRVIVVLGSAPPPAPRATKVSLRSRRASVNVRATVEVPPHLEGAPTMRLERRGGGVGAALASSSRSVRRSSGPCPVVRTSATLEWMRLTQDARHELYDAWVSVGEQGARVPGPRGWRRVRLHRDGRARSSAGRTWFVPRRTLKGRTLGVYAHTLPLETARELLRASRFIGVRRLVRGRRARPLWLIGELPFKAQDTGLAFFAHVVSKHPEVDARYVIAADAHDLEAARAVGPVVIADSPEHARAVLMADLIVCSHHPDYLFPLRTPSMNRRVRAPRVFLQHGVMGTKWMAGLYGRDASGFDVDQVHVSSPREKALLVRDFGYSTANVEVTGLTRFDSLLAPRSPRAQVLVVPTWRDGINTSRDLDESEFLAQWHALLSDPRVVEAVGKRDLVMMLHPNMRRLAGAFTIPGVRVIVQGEEPVQRVLLESELVVTDYSSVGFDAAIAGLPVVYFQFDRAAFLGAAGSHLDLDADLPGVIAVTRDAAIAAIRDVCANGVAQSPEAAALARAYFPAHDRDSCERAFVAVTRAKRPRLATSRRSARVAARMLARRIEKSRFAAIAARVVSGTAGVLPTRDDLIVFESERGRTYSGSPRALYQELCARGDESAKVWAVTGGIPDADASTSSIVPGSLRHAWALGRARHWVSDQSQREGIVRGRGQIFIQTWHGTPLKRMLHDALSHEGRDDGYVSRATAGARQWSILLSASGYASEHMASAFRHRARVLELGSPRNDVLVGDLANLTRERVRRALGIPPDSAVVLHAPTFRDGALRDASAGTPTRLIDLDRFHEEFGERAVLVLRRHFLDRSEAAIPASARGSVIDASRLPDVSALLCATDVLITDYSSVFFDFLCTGRPILFFAPDLDEYRDSSRGLYLEVSELPGPLLTTNDELARAITYALDRGVAPGIDLAAARETYCPHDDGHAARAVVDSVFGAGAR